MKPINSGVGLSTQDCSIFERSPIIRWKRSSSHRMELARASSRGPTILATRRLGESGGKVLKTCDFILAKAVAKTMVSDLSKVYDRSRVPLYIQVASVMRRRIETESVGARSEDFDIGRIGARIRGRACDNSPGD